jgi:hypothetical protein
MYVTEIEINEIPNSGETRGSVSFCSYERQIQVMCEIKEEGLQDKVKRRLAFIREALRQVRRMPEYRNGRSQIDFEPGLLPDNAL